MGLLLTREKMMRAFLTAVFSFVMLAQAAHADEASGMYVGAGAGQISIQGVDGNTTGYKAFFGGNFNPYFGIEAAYIDAGSGSAAVYDPNTGVSAYAEVAVKAAQVSLLGKIPLSRYFGLFGRVDGIYWRSDASATASDPYGNAAWYSGYETGTGLGWGAGGEASLGNFAVRAEFEQSSINSSTYRLISGSLIYRY
jgi:OOP family OmpA-OmpF porin